MHTLFKYTIFICAALSFLGLISLGLNSAVTSSYFAIPAIFISLILSVFKPELALACFLFLLPVFGNKPGTSQAYNLLILGMSLHLGLTLSYFSKKKSAVPNKPLSVAFWYLLVSALSFFPISFIVFLDWCRASQDTISNYKLLIWNFSSILLAREDESAYPLLSVFWTALSFSLCFFIYEISLRIPKARIFFACSLLLGFICSLAVGLLCYYDFINLESLRSLDPVVNPGGTQYRLQSWFGHSGWYAEYVTMLAPFAMLILLLKRAYWLRVSLLLVLLLIGELVLILTFQRGGWLSYPLTLLAVWASIYVIKRIEQGDLDIFTALKASTFKILISLPITVLISFLILQVFGSQFGLNQYSERFKDITKASDRTEFVRAGFLLGSLNPLFGQGSESFAIRYKREFQNIDGKYYGQIDLPLHGTAHNLYAQIFSGKGILGLLCLLGLMFSAVKHGYNFVVKSKTQNDRFDQIVALACICSVISCFVYGFVQELFYVQSLQYCFFAVIGILASLKQNSGIRTNSFKKIGFIIVFLFMVHLAWGHIFKRPYKDAFGCSQVESGQGGNKWSWCGLRSSLDVPVTELQTKVLNLQAAPSAIKTKHQVQVISCDQVIFSKDLAPSQKASFQVDTHQLTCQESPPGFVRLHAFSGAYFIPAENDRKSKDRRILALKWLME